MRPVKLIVRNLLNRAGFEVIRGRALNLHHQLLRTLFDELAIDQVVDVGAHWGEFGSYLRRTVGYAGAITSFEPIAANFEKLAARARADGRWTARQQGLGPTAERRTINVMHSTDYSSLLPARGGLTRLEGVMNVDRTETIELARLDDLADELAPAGARIFLKTDTQGFDLHVLEGAPRFLERVAMLQMELAIKPIYEGVPHYCEVLERMEERGYAIAGTFPVTRDKNRAVIEFDCVLINERVVPAEIPSARRRR
jgi:FkbM family methyltransferase